MANVQKLIKEEFSGHIIEGINPMECVAIGAAVGGKATDIIPRTYGIFDRDNYFVDVLKKGEHIPAWNYTPWKIYPLEGAITIDVVQEREKPYFVRLGKCECTVKPENFVMDVWIAMYLDSNHTLKMAVIPPSGEEYNEFIANPEEYRGIFTVELKREIGASRENPDVDKKMEELFKLFSKENPFIIDVLFGAMGLVGTAKKKLKLGVDINDKDRKEIEDLICDLDIKSGRLYYLINDELRDLIGKTEKERMDGIKKIGRGIEEVRRREVGEVRDKTVELKAFADRITRFKYKPEEIKEKMDEIVEQRDRSATIEKSLSHGDPAKQEIGSRLNELEPILKVLKDAVEKRKGIPVDSDRGDMFEKAQRLKEELRIIDEHQS